MEMLGNVLYHIFVLVVLLLVIIISAMHFYRMQLHERFSRQSYSQLAAKLLTLFGVTLPGLPWNVGALMLYERGLKNLGYLLFALSYPINGSLVVGLTNYLVYRGRTDSYRNKGHEWQVAALSYSAGMLVLALAALIARKRARRRGADEDQAEAGMHAAVLRSFGVQARSAGHSDRWTYPLLALLAAQAGYFVATYFFGDHPELVCARFEGSKCELPYFLPLLEGGDKICCAAVQRNFQLDVFLAAFGGNVVTGYGVVKYTAKMLLIGDATVRLQLQNPLLPQLNPRSSSERRQLRSRSVSSALAPHGVEESIKLSAALTSNPGISMSAQSEPCATHFRGTSRSSSSSASGSLAPASAPANARKASKKSASTAVDANGGAALASVSDSRQE